MPDKTTYEAPRRPEVRSLREYYAAHAPAAPDIYVQHWMTLGSVKLLQLLADWAFTYADAMIERGGK